MRSADGLFEVRGLQFPAAHLYNHEPCYALMLRNPSPSPAAVSFTFPAAGTVSATLSPFEIRFSTESSLCFMSL